MGTRAVARRDDEVYLGPRLRPEAGAEAERVLRGMLAARQVGLGFTLTPQQRKERTRRAAAVTEQGSRLPRADHDRDLVTMAAAARVAIGTLQTGGVATEGEGASVAVVNGFQLAALRHFSGSGPGSGFETRLHPCHGL